MKQEFIEFLERLMQANPELTEKLMTDNVKLYIEALKESKKNEKPELTDNGKLILKYMQGLEPGAYKSKDIADGMFISSRTVSGGMRKLVTDNFVAKIPDSEPVMYMITEKGKNYKIEEND